MSESKRKKKSYKPAKVNAKSSGIEGWAVILPVSLALLTSLNLSFTFLICKTKKVSFIIPGIVVGSFQDGSLGFPPLDISSPF